jgi:hypothetical protein
MVARPKAWNVYARSNIGIVGSNPTQDRCVWLYFVFVLGSGMPAYVV